MQSVISWVRLQINELLKLIHSTSPFSRAVYKCRRAFQHIVVSGDLSQESVRELLVELFHEDHGVNSIFHVVFLSPEEPSFTLQKLLGSPEYLQNTLYVQGSPFDDRDLNRACVTNALAVLFLCDKVTCNVSVSL